MRRTLTTTLAALALALAACGDDDDNGGGDSSKAGEKYPAEIRDNFISECDAQPNAPKAVCECALAKIEKKYSLDEFKKIDKAQREGEPLPGDIRKMVEDCVAQET
jgi:hypothetical protein